MLDDTYSNHLILLELNKSPLFSLVEIHVPMQYVSY